MLKNRGLSLEDIALPHDIVERGELIGRVLLDIPGDKR
jgi:hypothetical protein